MWVHFSATVQPIGGRDFDPLWYAARLLWQGLDPYPLIGPGKPYPSDWGLWYPLPAVLVLMPLAALPLVWARAVFIGVTSGLLAYGVTRERWRPLVLFLSFGYYDAMASGQWSPLLAAMAVLPGLSWLAACKPNMAAAVVGSTLDWRAWRLAVVGGVALTAVSLVVLPGWPAEWWAAARGGASFIVAPVTLPGGVLALAALARWRRPEARLLAFLACVPQTSSNYDFVLFWLLPQSWPEYALLFALERVAFHFSYWAIPHAPGPAFAAYLHDYAPLRVALLYLPLTLMVRRRPNVGTVPAWAERAVAALPRLTRWSARTAPQRTP